MLFRVHGNLEKLEPLAYQNISERYSKNEKDLENLMKTMVGKDIFQEYLIFGHERSQQSEPDLFGIDGEGNLVVFELKVAGQFDINKIYQAMGYAQSFSGWNYDDMNDHFHKCYPHSESKELENEFYEHFGYPIDKSKLNEKQKIIIVSSSSGWSISKIVEYWRSKGIDIIEYFYRFYEIDGISFLEISDDSYITLSSGHCLVNTCRRFDENAYLEMVRNRMAAAYGNRAISIKNSMKGKYIFLYHNEYGVIAAGVGTAKIKSLIHEYPKGKEEETNITLRDFIHSVNIESGQIDRYISASDLKTLLNQKFFFSKVVVPLAADKAKLLYDHCKLLFSKHE